MKTLELAFKWFDRCLKCLLVLLALAMIVIGSAQIFFRYVLALPLTWSEEAIRFMFIWLTFLAFPIGIGQDIHPSFNILAKKVPEQHQKTYQTLLFSVTGLVLAALVIIGVPYAAANMYQFTPALKLPYAYVIAAVPAGGAIGLIYITHCIIRVFQKEGT